MKATFKWENVNGGKFGYSYSFSLRNTDDENMRRIWSLALNDAHWENRESLRIVDSDGNTLMTWPQYLEKYENVQFTSRLHKA